MADEEEEPTSGEEEGGDGGGESSGTKAARIVVGIVMLLFCIYLLISVFMTQTNLIRALAFGSAFVLFVLTIVQMVL